MKKTGQITGRGFLGFMSVAAFGLAAKNSPQPTKPGGTIFITERPRKTPVARQVDVLVVGGGPTGVGAALAASSEGASVLVLERFGMLGGIWTSGLQNPLFDPNKGWIVGQLIERLKQARVWKELDAVEIFGLNRPHQWIKLKDFFVFDIEVMKYTLEKMMAQAGIEYWYHAHKSK